jgi:hypothetical protein
MTDMTKATVTCAVCGGRQTFLGSQWEVTVAAEVWEKTHGRSAHDGERVPVRVEGPQTRRDLRRTRRAVGL